MNQQVQINSLKYDRRVKRSWTCELIERRGSLLVLLGAFDVDIAHAQLGSIERGTVSYEYYWLDRWYNVFRFLEPGGTLRNYYCNINMPPTFENETLDYVDLDIDVVVWPDFSFQVLDADEFELNAQHFGYPEDIHLSAYKALDEVRKMIAFREFPFDCKSTARAE